MLLLNCNNSVERRMDTARQSRNQRVKPRMNANEGQFQTPEETGEEGVLQKATEPTEGRLAAAELE